jgi:hypothetical protein
MRSSSDIAVCGVIFLKNNQRGTRIVKMPIAPKKNAAKSDSRSDLNCKPESIPKKPNKAKGLQPR